jgi:curli biogenesis system outer membrane secretion channel CsgG
MKRFFTVSCLVFFLFVCAVPAFSVESVRIGIVGFESRVQGLDYHRLGSITDIFTRELANSRIIEVFERERLDEIARQQRLDLSGLVNQATASRVGELTGINCLDKSR